MHPSESRGLRESFFGRVGMTEFWYLDYPDLREDLVDFYSVGEDASPTEEELEEAAAEVRRREEEALLFHEQAEELF